MNKLLSDDLVAKYRSLPEFVWYIFVAISVFFANAYEYIFSAGVNLKEMTNALAEYNLPIAINSIAFIVITCVFSAIISTLIFELINHLVAGILLGRFGCKTNRNDLKFRLRICYIYSNLFIGLIGISYFFTQTQGGNYTGVFNAMDYTLGNDVYTILSCLIPFSSLTFFIFVFFEDTRKRFLPKRNQARALTYFSRIYFGITLAINLFGSVFSINTDAAVIDIVANWLPLGVTALWTVGAYLYYLYIKKQPDDTTEEPIQVIIEEKKSNIYDDFGF